MKRRQHEGKVAVLMFLHPVLFHSFPIHTDLCVLTLMSLLCWGQPRVSGLMKLYFPGPPVQNRSSLLTKNFLYILKQPKFFFIFFNISLPLPIIRPQSYILLVQSILDFQNSIFHLSTDKILYFLLKSKFEIWI